MRCVYDDRCMWDFMRGNATNKGKMKNYGPLYVEQPKCGLENNINGLSLVSPLHDIPPRFRPQDNMGIKDQQMLKIEVDVDGVESSLRYKDTDEANDSLRAYDTLRPL